MVVCIAEDRACERVAVQLLIASLARHCPGVEIELIYPPDDPPMTQWLARFPNVTLRTSRVAEAEGWNVKPFALQALLEAGHDEVWWIDSDIIVCSDFRTLLGQLDPTDVVAAEEARYGQYRDDGFRARACGFEVGRVLPFSLNSGIMRVTQSHRELVAAWCQVLKTPVYLEAQACPSNERPFHLYGDQDVLTALLASSRFSHLPLKILRRGAHIIQDFGPAGYTVAERARNLWRQASLVHCQRDKPWLRAETPPPLRDAKNFFNYMRMEASPYILAAQTHQDDVAEPMPWLSCRSHAGRLLRAAGFGHPALTGLPLAVFYSVGRLKKWLQGVDDRFDPAEAYASLDKKWRNAFPGLASGLPRAGVQRTGTLDPTGPPEARSLA